MFRLEVEPLDLGTDVKAVGLELVERDSEAVVSEPARGPEAARIWSRVIPAAAGTESWRLDFFSHLHRVREFCQRQGISFSETSSHALLIPPPEQAALQSLLERFEGETFGVRAGGAVAQGDAALEGALVRRGADAYHSAFANYFFCAICNLAEGSLVLLSNRLWAAEVIRRVRPALSGLGVEVVLSS